MIILLCDGSSSGNPGPIRIGFVIWDRSGNPRIAKPVYTHSEDKGAGTCTEAEYESIIEGMKYVLTMDPKNDSIYVYSDSQLVINQINGDWRVKHENCRIPHEEVSQLIYKFTDRACRLYFVWIPRQLTYLADREANRRP